MALEKTDALILRTIPFGETSTIATLFTRAHGLSSVIFKGVRSSKKRSDFIERGFLIETNVYRKPGRDMDTGGTFSVKEFFEATRNDIIRSAVRDCAFEIIISVFHDAEEHTELFDFFYRFLAYLNKASEDEVYPAVLWLFLFRFSQHAGWGFSLDGCVECGGALAGGGSLLSGEGGVVCTGCRKKNTTQFIPEAVISYLTGKNTNGGTLATVLTKQDAIRLTGLFTDYIRWHAHVNYEFKSEVFLREIV